MKRKYSIIVCILVCILSYHRLEANYDPNLNPFSKQAHYKIDFSGNQYEETDVYLNLQIQKEEKEQTIHFNIPNALGVLKKLGKKKIDQLVAKNVIQISGADIFCNDYLGQSCILERGEMKTNTKVFRNYKILAEKEKSIQVTVYPFDPEKYTYDSYFLFENNIGSPRITFFDTSGEFYGVRITDLGSFQKSGFVTDKKFVKRYKLVKMEKGNYMYLPYYTTNIHVQPGENNFRLEYNTYTDLDPDTFGNIRLKIK